MPALTLGLKLNEITAANSSILNLCIVAGYDGSKWYGYDIGLGIGSADPDETNDGQKFYAYLWDDAGNFFFKFGLAGNEPVPGVVSIFVYAPEYRKGRIALWDEVTECYTFQDQILADKLIDKYNSGTTDFCIYMGVENGLVLDYHYDYVGVGEIEPPKVQIRYWTDDSSFASFTPVAEGGSAEIINNGDGSYDLISYDEVTFIGPSDDQYEMKYSGVTKIEFIRGESLKVFAYQGNAPTFAYIDSLEHIIFSGYCKPDITRDMFRANTSMLTADLTGLDMSNTVNCEGMFYGCSSLECITNLNTTNANSKSGMFKNCDNLQQPDAAAQADLTDEDGADWVNPNP